MKKYLKIKNKKIFKKIYILYLPVLIIGILFTIIPFIELIKQSFIEKNPYNYSSIQYSNKNYENVLKDPRFIIGFYNTLILIFIVSPILFILFFFISLLISTISFKFFKNSFIAIIFSQFFVSSYSIGISFLVLFGSKTNVLNSIFNTNINWNSPNEKTFSFLYLVIFYTWKMSVISIILFSSGINKIHKNKFLLAKLDNLNLWQKIKFIYIPNLKEIIFIQIYLFIFQSLFFYPTIYKNPYITNNQTIMTYIIDNLEKNGSPLNWALAAAASIFLITLSFTIIFIIIILKMIIKFKKKLKEKHEYN